MMSIDPREWRMGSGAVPQESLFPKTLNPGILEQIPGAR
jgi:hypothetical protein